MEVLDVKTGNVIWIQEKFASYTRDSSTGLDYADQRYYNSMIGRFIQADPNKGDTSVPQSWNRYAYVNGDPANNIDPSGLFLSAYRGEDYPGGANAYSPLPQPEQPPPREPRPGGSTFESRLPRSIAGSLINLASQGDCGSVLPISQLQDTSINFLNGSDPVIANSVISSLFPSVPINETIGSVLNQYQSAGSIVPAFTLIRTNEIVIGPAYSAVSSGNTLEQEQENTLQHEALHVFYQEGDVQLANRLFGFPLQTPAGTSPTDYTAAASESISAYLLGGCKHP